MNRKFPAGSLVRVKSTYPPKLNPGKDLRGKKGRIHEDEVHHSTGSPLVVFPVNYGGGLHRGGVLDKPRGWYIAEEYLEVA